MKTLPALDRVVTELDRKSSPLGMGGLSNEAVAAIEHQILGINIDPSLNVSPYLLPEDKAEKIRRRILDLESTPVK